MKECKHVKSGECEPSKMPPIDPNKYNVTESGQVLKSENSKIHRPALLEHEYNKIQNYIEAIRLIAEKIRTAESDCIEQLARDVGNYLYDLVKGDKDE